MALQEGDPAPDFTLPRDGGTDVSLSALRGRKVVLYAYPKDNTPACTEEAIAFNRLRGEFAACGTEIIGGGRGGIGGGIRLEHLVPGNHMTELVQQDLIPMQSRSIGLVKEVVGVLTDQPHPVGHAGRQRLAEHDDRTAATIAEAVAQLNRIEGEVEVEAAEFRLAQTTQSLHRAQPALPWRGTP